MSDLAARIRAKFTRRHSNVPSLPSTGSVASHSGGSLFKHRSRPRSLQNVDRLTGNKSRAESSSASVAEDKQDNHPHSNNDDDGQQQSQPPDQPASKREISDQGHELGASQDSGLSHSLIMTPSYSTATVDQSQTPPDDRSTPATATTATALTALSPASSAGLDHPKSGGTTGSSDNVSNDLRPSPTSKLSSINEHPPIQDHHHHHQETPGPPVDATSELPKLSTSEDNSKQQELSENSAPMNGAALSPSPLPPRSRSPKPGKLPIPKPTVVSLTLSRPTTPTLNLPTSSRPTTPTSLRAVSTASRPAGVQRQQSLVSNNKQTSLIQTLLRGTQGDDAGAATTSDQLPPLHGKMVTRKIWVKRPGASATRVTINEDDVVDDVRDMILRKYGNSLGRTFDSPDLTLRIKPREQLQERTLGPEEPVGRTLDAYFSGGQTVDEALIIDVPLRRTPRASPRAGPPHAPHMQSVYFTEDARPSEAGNDYFGPGAFTAAHLPVTITAPSGGSGHSHAMTVLSTGQVPQVPSPGGSRSRVYRERPDRPRLGRQHTSSPTILNLVNSAHQGPGTSAVPHGTHLINSKSKQRSRTHSSASSEQSANVPAPPPLPTPPAADASAIPQRIATPPPARVSSPRPIGSARPKKSKKNVDHPSLPKGMLNGSVPPINVLIVEDNIINLKLLEAFVKRLKVRWNTAMNGRDAVNKWREGGFHLVLMDIQLPVMSGLDATREIRRLERVNSIGVFSSAASTAPQETKNEPSAEDKLANTDLFKSPVIIVALTASSLQSDRHEALAAGCNDFLTKPVNFVWLERKVMEWGCMQALIDFDGWRKWKDFSAKAEEERAAAAAAKAAATQKAKTKKNRSSLTNAVSIAA